MNCKYCNESAGFMQSFHNECNEKFEELLIKRDDIIYECNSDNSDGKSVKIELMNLAKNKIYSNYMNNSIIDKTIIRTKEVIIHVESSMKVYESKNRCTMTRIGYSYEKTPIWKEYTQLIGKLTTIVYTDESIYIILFNSVMRYPYKKIVNVGYDEKKNYLYFDVKTTSPYAHRFMIGEHVKLFEKEVKLMLKLLNSLVDSK